ncbi:MAG: hypothetical protein M1508_00645 [Nitrospirae bacterium]|nr:hypothetical protein [Nitrospirota bacterium]MCL5422941.1 hypothetical protein [Nitrospirota bacterium]
MAGDRHQFILGLVIKKMREEGATVYGVDGNYPGLFGERISLPPQIMRHRPDAIGVKADGQICIGEAKTENDISNSRTYEQLQDFSAVELNGRLCEVFIGVPQTGEDLFNRSLERWGLKGSQNIYVLFVPDEIIND